MSYFNRMLGAQKNQLVQGCGSLMGIATGLLADNQLNDAEICFLRDWLKANAVITTTWPGDVLYDRIEAVLSDGKITSEERQHLVETLTAIIGGSTSTVIEHTPVNQLAFDEISDIDFDAAKFCVTGEFIFGPRPRVIAEIESRGGIVSGGITKRLDYLIVGLKGSDEWKHGSYGTKIEKAVSYRRDGVPLAIVSENVWSASL